MNQLIFILFLFSVSDNTTEQVENYSLCFIENQGQVDKAVDYYIPSLDKTFYFNSEGVTLSFSDKKSEDILRYTLKLDFIDADPAKPKGVEKQKAVFSYFKGKPEDWRTNLPTFGKLIYEELWPGIDLVYSGTTNQLKYEFLVAPGADPGRVKLRYRGASEMHVTEKGELSVTTPMGSFLDDTPYAYQWIDGKRKKVSMSYQPGEGDPEVGLSYGFDVGAYDPEKPLILDPALLVYCGYLGGVDFDQGHAIAVDASGCAYITGASNSDHSTFPVLVGPDIRYNGGFLPGDAFVAKIDVQGRNLIYCGYIGGLQMDSGSAIAVDGDGCAYVTGTTTSDENTFPVINGPDLTHNGYYDGFVAKVNALGTDLDYCGFLGGSSNESGAGITVNESGNAFITGYTSSDETTFPVNTGPDLTYNGGTSDGFVAKVNTSGMAMDYCGYLGGAHTDSGRCIALDDLGRAYIAGMTHSNHGSFPVNIGPDLTFNGNEDGFIARVNGQGTGLDYCGYMGGEESDWANGIAVDKEYNAYVTGSTFSDESTFPVTIGPCLLFNGFSSSTSDAFVAKITDQGSSLIYCGYIGGRDEDRAEAIAVDEAGRACVAGHTKSNIIFPVTAGPDLTYNGNRDAFVAMVNTSGTGLSYCGYIGGEDHEVASGIAMDQMGNSFITGFTHSDESTFPVLAGPTTTYSGEGDAFIAKVSLALTASSLTVSEQGGSVNFYLYAGMDEANRNYLLLGGATGTEPGYPLPGGLVTLPLNLDSFTYNVLFPLLNTTVFSNFMGTLDSDGRSTATLNMPALPPGHVGTKLNFAYCMNNPFDYASDPVEIEIIP